MVLLSLLLFGFIFVVPMQAAMIVAGLHYLHINDVIHRDVKPANVLLHTYNTGETVVKLGDFGLSQQHVRWRKSRGVSWGISSPDTDSSLHASIVVFSFFACKNICLYTIL